MEETVNKTHLAVSEADNNDQSEKVPLSLSNPMDEEKNKTEDVCTYFTNTVDYENDRSFEEVEVPSHIYVGNFDEKENMLQDNPPSDISLQSDCSIISLNYLQYIEDQQESIIDEDIQYDPVEFEEDNTNSSKEQTFNIFDNLDLDDKSMSDIRHNIEPTEKQLNVNTHFEFEPVLNQEEPTKKLKDFEELVHQLDSFKEASNTNTISTLSTTEYKQLQEEWHGKLLNLNGAIVYKDELIQQLTESLDQSVRERKDMIVQIEHLKTEILKLKGQLRSDIYENVESANIDCISTNEEQHRLDPLQIKDKYETEILVLKENHKREIDEIKELHQKLIVDTLKEVTSDTLKDENIKEEADTANERDTLKRQVSSMRTILKELSKYFSQCEDELNNTLVEELLKPGFDRNLFQIENELNCTPSSPSSSSKTIDSTFNITRVHLTPNFTDLINMIESSSTEEGHSKDISVGFKNELEVCLEKLKYEANAILTLTNNMTKQTENENCQIDGSEEKISSLTKQLNTKSQTIEDLQSKLEENQKYINSLETETKRLEMELERVISNENILENVLTSTNNKTAQSLESCDQEIVSMGYGEAGVHLQNLDNTAQILANLQEKARNVLSGSRTTADSSLIHLIEELCWVGERIKHESLRDREDFLQQIEAANKKYKTNQTFLEEQAMEREHERDEAQKKIDYLYNELKQREKDKINSSLVVAEMNQLENQLQEKSTALAASLHKIKEIETDRNEAVAKINVLREIIKELEVQIESKSEEIRGYLETIGQFQKFAQERIRDSEEIISHKNVTDLGELYAHMEQLENELQHLKMQSDFGGNEGVTKQILLQLYEIESQVDRKTKELETLHSTASTNCSSPSEDISARDLVLPKSPKKTEVGEVPLQQLTRLKEKLVRHSRAEDTAIKRIKDLEMQIFALKQELQETTGEREYMKKQIQEQLVLISDFQIRLDEQRIKADNIEKQTNTSFELKIYDLQNEVVCLQEKLHQKEKHINNQLDLLTETQERLRSLEKEVSSPKEDDLVLEMKKEIKNLQLENIRLKNKIQNEANMVPNLVENIISDKNVDMERLRLKLDDTTKLLEAYTSLNLSKKDLQTIANRRSSCSDLDEHFSLSDLSLIDQVRKTENEHINESVTPSILLKRQKSESTIIDYEPSSIREQNTEHSLKKVHFEDVYVENLKQEIVALKDLLDTKEKVIQEYEEKQKLLTNLEIKIEKLQTALDENEKSYAAACEAFEKQHKDIKAAETELKAQLVEKITQLAEKQTQLDDLDCACKEKEEMCKQLISEKNTLEKELTTLKHENFVNVDNAIKVKNAEIECLNQKINSKISAETEKIKNQLLDQSEEAERLLRENESLLFDLEESHVKNNQLEEALKEHSKQIASLEETVNEHFDRITKLNNELEHNLTQLNCATAELNCLKEKLNKKRKIIKDLEDTVASQKTSLLLLEEEQQQQKLSISDTNCTIDNLNEDVARYQNDIAVLEADIKALKKEDITQLKTELKKKEEIINDLNTEKAQMLELLAEKEKIINQMAEDSHQLHANLVTIKSKIKEPGNIIDLGNKLKEEQQKTAELIQEIHNLKIQLMKHKNYMTSSVDEIANQLQREVDNSIKIDTDIMSAISDKSLESLSEKQDIELYRKYLLQEKIKNKQLLQHAHKLEVQIMELKEDLEKERLNMLQTRTENAQCIQKLTTQLGVVLDNDDTLKKIIAEKESENDQLEREVHALKRKNVNSASKSESTDYQQLPSESAITLSHLKKEYDILLQEKNKLSNEFAILKQATAEMETDYKYTKYLLSLEIQKKNDLEDKVHSLQLQTNCLKDNLAQKSLEIKRIIDENSQEKANLKKQNLEFGERKTLQSPVDTQSPAATIAASTSDEVFAKIMELNNALIENKKLMDLITKISFEKKQMEHELQTLKDLVKNSPTTDLMVRADYIFAKTLKLESTKKALIFQKKYLMQYLMARKYSVEALPIPLGQMKQFQMDFTLKHRFKSAALVIISILRMKYLVRRWRNGVRIAEKINSKHYIPLDKNNHPNVVSARFQVGQPVSNQFFLNVPGTISKSKNPFVILEEEAKNQFDNLKDEMPSVADHVERIIPWSGKTPPSKQKRNAETVEKNVFLKEEHLSFQHD